MKVFERFWVEVEDDWTKVDLDMICSGVSDPMFVIEPTLSRLPGFLAYVSLNHPSSMVFFNIIPGGAMVYGQGTYGKNSYGVKQ